jgi:ribosomal protein S18 acetylase RimI-like enzyme
MNQASTLLQHTACPEAPGPFSSVIRPTTSLEAELLANVLARAFYDEPPYTYLMPDDQERRIVLTWFFSSVIRAGQYVETYTTSTVEGGSLWIHPGRALAFEQIVRAKLRSMSFKLGWASLKRCVTLAERMERVHRRLAPHPHWYLVTLGVQPSQQEAAVRQALIEPVLSQADTEGLSCYVEVFNESNLPFYEEHGFHIEGGGRIPGCELNLWSLMRAPRQ